jgi:hypothetical protein
MKTLLLAGVTLALLTAANFAPAMAQGPKLSIGNTWAGISQPVDDTQPIYPIPGTMYGEVISKYRIGSDHKAVYENLTGNQMWSIVQSKFGRPSQQSAIAELGPRKIDAPGCAEEASGIDRALDWHHLQKPAQPVVDAFQVDLIDETTRHLIGNICHSQYQM